MKIKRIIAGALACATMFALAACGTNNADVAQGDEENVIILATNAEFPPFEFVADQDAGVVEKYDGIDILIGAEIAKDLGCELKIENMKFESILAAVATGKADMALAGMTVKPDRLENADFSIPYWVAVQTILVPEDNTDIVDVESLRDKTIGVVTGYTGDSALVEKGFESNLKRYTKGVDAVMDLKAGNLDAVVIDSPTANRFVEKLGGIKAINDEAAFETEEYAIGVKKGNTELLEKINATITRLLENGDIERFAAEVDSRLK